MYAHLKPNTYTVHTLFEYCYASVILDNVDLNYVDRK